MTYTTLADVYLGDVSSQVYEFLRVPRPCLFLNPHHLAWEADENYAHWHFGPVVEGTDRLIEAVDHVRAAHALWRKFQEHGVARTFFPHGGAAAAAKAISSYLQEDASSAQWGRPERRVPLLGSTGWAVTLDSPVRGPARRDASRLRS